MDQLPYREFLAMIQERTREAGVPYNGSFELTPLCNHPNLTLREVNKPGSLTVLLPVLRKEWPEWLDSREWLSLCRTSDSFQQPIYQQSSLGVLIQIEQCKKTLKDLESNVNSNKPKR